jgi:molecular chaperone DnaK (HSP70)
LLSKRLRIMDFRWLHNGNKENISNDESSIGDTCVTTQVKTKTTKTMIVNGKKQTENQENEEELITSKHLNNISLNSSYNNYPITGHGPLSISQRFLNSNKEDSFNLSINDSFESTSQIKLDGYKESITKLSNDNNALRKRVKKLTELVRTKEEQLMEAFSEAIDEKNKLEEKSREEYDTKLQSYYECFSQIEKENADLKSQNEKLENKLRELKNIENKKGNFN